MFPFLQCGYRLIDCANDYDNEDVIGEALQELFEEGVCKRLVPENHSNLTPIEYIFKLLVYYRFLYL